MCNVVILSAFTTYLFSGVPGRGGRKKYIMNNVPRTGGSFLFLHQLHNYIFSSQLLLSGTSTLQKLLQTMDPVLLFGLLSISAVCAV